MKHKKVGAWSGFCIVFIILAIIITVFYFHRDERGDFKFSHTKYVHNAGISEYSNSSMVSFPIKGDYSNLVNKEVYYYESNNLRRGNLSSISLQSGKFMIDGTEHNTTDFLGQPSGGILILGSVLGFLTEKIDYICGILLPGILCLIYEGFAIYISLKEEK